MNDNQEFQPQDYNQEPQEMQEILPPDLVTHALKFRSSRNNLIMVVVFTFVNLVLAAAGSDFSFLFTAPIPSAIMFLLVDVGLMWVGLVIAVALTSVYLVLSIFARKVRALILVALILFACEAGLLGIVYLGLIALGEFDLFMIIELAFCGWILYYLVIGTIAWRKLVGVPQEVLDSVYAQATQQGGRGLFGRK